MNRAKRVKIKPYPAQYARSADPVDKLGLQIALGAGQFRTCCVRGAVSYQTKKLPSEVRRTGKLGKIKIKPISANSCEYNSGLLPISDPIPQEEILKEITEGLGLERRDEALAISIKENLLIQETNKLSEELQSHSAIQGSNVLCHYMTAVGDFTGVISRSLRLPRGFLRSPPRFVRNELVESGIAKRGDKVLGRIKSTIRTEWVMPEKHGWSVLLDVMQLLHTELTKPYWWQDVAVPTPIVFNGKTLTPPRDAQMYQLLRRKYIVTLQLPKDIME